MPQFADDSYVILPTSTLRDLLDKTDAEVDGHIIHNEHVESSYTLGDDISTDAFQLDVVRRQLTRKLHLFVGTVYSELALGFEDVWKPNHDEWKAIKVFPTCMKIVARAANRVFTGDSLCMCPLSLDLPYQTNIIRPEYGLHRTYTPIYRSGLWCSESH